MESDMEEVNARRKKGVDRRRVSRRVDQDERGGVRVQSSRWRVW